MQQLELRRYVKPTLCVVTIPHTFHHYIRHFCSLEIHCNRLSVTDDKAYQPGSAHPKSFTILKLILFPFGGQKFAVVWTNDTLVFF